MLLEGMYVNPSATTASRMILQRMHLYHTYFAEKKIGGRWLTGVSCQDHHAIGGRDVSCSKQ